MGQHLSHRARQNPLRRHLMARDVVPEDCISFRMTTFGPLFEQQEDMPSHKIPRDKVAALEKKLADSLRAAGYDVLNRVHCRTALDPALWRKVRSAFAKDYPRLLRASD